VKLKKAATLSDVARDSGVSVITVSGVINGSRSNVRVSSKTRARIEEVALRLGYRPNAVARSLAKRRINLIGIVVSFNASERLDHVFHLLLDGILEGCVKYHQRATIYSVSSSTIDERWTLHHCDGLADGFIFIAPAMPMDAAAKLAESTPFVTIHNSCSPYSATNIDVDNFAGGYMMTHHLTTLGHTKIAHVAGAAHRAGTTERYMGYKAALGGAGIPLDDELVIPGGYTYNCGRQAACAILDKYGSRQLPTAVFCANDAVGYGVIEGLQAGRVAIPEQVSVAGFDDASISSESSLQLTTIRQPLHSMGVYAVAKLMSMIDNQFGRQSDVSEDVQSPHRPNSQSDINNAKQFDSAVLFKPSLVIRNSVSPPSNLQLMSPRTSPFCSQDSDPNDALKGTY
jgi:LacI family transcriptional regulator